MDTRNEQEFISRFDLGLWMKMLGFLKRHSKTILQICALMASLAGLDAFFPLATKFAIDNFLVAKDLTHITPFVSVYVLAILAQVIILYKFIELGGRLETGIVYDIRKAGFENLQRLSFSYFDKTPVGWIMARMTTDAQRIGDVVAWSAVDIFWAVAIIVIAFIAMLFLNVKLALIELCIIPVLVAVNLYFQQHILKSQRQVRKINSRITAAFNEGIGGARTTKTLNREEANSADFMALTGSMRDASIRSAVLSAVFLPVVLSITAVGVGLMLWQGGEGVYNGIIEYGTLTVFISYTTQMFEPVQQIARIFSELQAAQASAERTFALVETQPDVVDTPESLERFGNPANWPHITGDIVFEDVSFGYKAINTGNEAQTTDGGDAEEDGAVLEHFSLHVKAGEKIALVGPTGAGKSTIVNLICRFYEPTGGVIKIDGADYRSRPQLWLQSNLGYVLQSPHLFSGSIMENIRYAKLDATDEEVIEAAKITGAYDFIMAKPDGFQTDVGEGGDRLSAGEKQLVSFARAILGDPRIFVLDEATSSIDTETEEAITSAVYKVLEGRTSFIVAHRLSTIRHCDRILVIAGGKIMESGSHKELIQKRGHYYNLYTNQFKREAESKILDDAVLTS